MKIKLLVAISFLSLLLVGCDQSNDKNYRYFGYSSNECSQIAFTCAQNETQFTNSIGCGCKISTQINNNVEERSLITLVNKYLLQKIIKPINNGKIFAFHTRIGAEEKDNILTYDAYGTIDEFFLKENKIYYGAKRTGIFQFKVEETNTNYIIRGYNFFDLNNLGENDKKLLTQDTQKWLNDKKNIENIEKQILTKIKQEAAISFGRTMDAFEDYVPTNTSTTQQSTTQQAAGTGTQQTK